jgi:hypothetical protein
VLSAAYHPVNRIIAQATKDTACLSGFPEAGDRINMELFDMRRFEKDFIIKQDDYALDGHAGLLAQFDGGIVDILAYSSTPKARHK